MFKLVSLAMHPQQSHDSCYQATDYKGLWWPYFSLARECVLQIKLIQPNVAALRVIQLTGARDAYPCSSLIVQLLFCLRVINANNMKSLSDHWTMHCSWGKGVFWRWCKLNRHFHMVLVMCQSISWTNDGCEHQWHQWLVDSLQNSQ